MILLMLYSNIMTSLQRRKFVQYFNCLDDDHNGILEIGDFTNMANTLCSLRGWHLDSDKYRDVHFNLMLFWNSIHAFADKNRDGIVTLSEWIAHKEYLVNASRDVYDDYIKFFSYGLFDLADENHDGSLSQLEYRHLMQAFHVGDMMARVAFEKLDLNHDGAISRYEFENALYELHFSNDPDAPGNWLFGEF